ncbi:hypothetical protein LEP1GSC116_2506 [Leptospira interrogans serovar Icterohaemorrhagiae str. Verdun HP]|uniref:Uncharacterized protein n=1 Tax=Leptospira interrogans serovar Icterohaemorrhagiae str. Verdun HP TaxID=1049910 RepID=M6RGR0_LEPIR|nr:hypothetical protein LEP1GSC116_2506 [Leptospira interrogans serovar Icterohaemorrhagiae str. Verdun HP]
MFSLEFKKCFKNFYFSLNHSIKNLKRLQINIHQTTQIFKTE